MKKLLSLFTLSLCLAHSGWASERPFEELEKVLHFNNRFLIRQGIYSEANQQGMKIPFMNPVDQYVKEASTRYKLPETLIKAIIKVESDFVANAVSPKGCIGLMQLHPMTASELGVNPWDVRQNIMGGSYYFRKMLQRFGTVKAALWAYNAGPSRVVSNGKLVHESQLPEETRKYAVSVLRTWEQITLTQ